MIPKDSRRLKPSLRTAFGGGGPREARSHGATSRSDLRPGLGGDWGGDRLASAAIILRPLLLVFAVSLAVAWIAAPWIVLPRQQWIYLAPDFRVFYRTGQAVWAGASPFASTIGDEHPNLNPPAFAWLCAPFALLSPMLAWLVWTALGLTALGLTARRIARVARVPAWAVALGMLVTGGAFISLRLGEVGFFVALLVTAAWEADRTHRPRLAGSLIGIAMAWKLFLLLLVPWFLWRRDWRLLRWTAVGAGAVFLAGLALGPSTYLDWFAALQRSTEWRGAMLNASLAGMADRNHWPTFVLWLMRLVVLALLAVSAPRSDIDRGWALLLAGALLLSPLGWIYYTLMLAGPLLVTLRSAPRPAQGLAVTGFLCGCLLLPEYGPTASAYGVGLLLAFVGLYGSQPTTLTGWATATGRSPMDVGIY